MAAVVSVSFLALAALRLGPSAPVQPRLRVAPQLRCLNTFGRGDRVADSRGHVCSAGDLDGEGCCCGATKPICGAQSCCDSYEDCVASCVTRGQKTLLRRRASHGLLQSPRLTDWDLCRFKCLTNSGSVLHQNSYRSAAHFCFGLDRPSLDLSQSVNSIDPNAHDDVDLDPTDPYVRADPGFTSWRHNASGGFGRIFPCTHEGCAVPEQDRAKLKDQRRRPRRPPRSYSHASKKDASQRLRPPSSHGSHPRLRGTR